MRWFRFYTEALNDPKVQSLRPELFKAWVNFLSLAALEEKSGVIGKPEDVAFSLRVRPAKLLTWLDELVTRRLIDHEGDCYIMHNWPLRQPKSDDSSSRVRALRGRSKPVTASVANPLQRALP